MTAVVLLDHKSTSDLIIGMANRTLMLVMHVILMDILTSRGGWLCVEKRSSADVDKDARPYGRASADFVPSPTRLTCVSPVGQNGWAPWADAQESSCSTTHRPVAATRRQ